MTQSISRRRLLAKVPEITVYFWIVKLLTTAMGEATSDYFVHHINPYIAVILGGIGFVVALVLQLSIRRYVAWVYWFLVVMVAIFGTMVADVTHVVLGVPYYASTIAFALILISVFAAWHRTEHTLSIHSIYTNRREWFYWATVLSTFALGTAAGDMTAVDLHLGYEVSGALFGGMFLLAIFSYKWLGFDEITTFWFAYILTRPLGASFADWFGMPHSFGGLGYGKGLVSFVLSALIIGCVWYLSVTHKDVQSDFPDV